MNPMEAMWQTDEVRRQQRAYGRPAQGMKVHVMEPGKLVCERWWMYQGNLVELLELNGCVARVKLVEEPNVRSFAVFVDDLVDLVEWRGRVTAQQVEAPADLVEKVDLEIRRRQVKF